jgi:hypothetical protein
VPRALSRPELVGRKKTVTLVGVEAEPLAGARRPGTTSGPSATTRLKGTAYLFICPL